MEDLVTQSIFLPEPVYDAIFAISGEISIREIVDRLFWRAMWDRNGKIKLLKDPYRPIKKASILIEPEIRSQLFRQLGFQFYDLAFALGDMIESLLEENIDPACPDLAASASNLACLHGQY